MLKLTKTMAQRYANHLCFSKMNGLVPAIAQDYITGEVLMLAFMNKEALVRTLTTGKMWYYSRTKKRLWKKGEVSKNEQIVQRAYFDCDCDSLLFKVKQLNGCACHRGTRTCFDQDDFPLERLFSIIEERKEKPVKGSYTNKLLKDKKLALSKVCEESREVLQAVILKEGKKALTWEAADLIYHLFVLLETEGISLTDLQQELKKRHEKKGKKR